MTGERSSAKAAWLGAWWGLGHTLTLLAAGTALVVLRAEMPAMATMACELGVVLLLVGFGTRAIYQAACGAIPVRTHSHAKSATSSLFHVDRLTVARPLLVALYTGWREAARSPRSWWPRCRRRRRGSGIWRCLVSDPPWGWWRCRACWVGRSREWALIGPSCARSHWPLAVSRPCSVCSGAIHCSVGCSRGVPEIRRGRRPPWPCPRLFQPGLDGMRAAPRSCVASGPEREKFQ